MNAPVLQIGDIAPAFTLPRDGGAMISLADQAPSKVVLYFYPKDATPGCTLEALDFNALLPSFQEAGAVVIGISKDSVAAHDKFCAKQGLQIILASDAEGQTCEDYGVWVEKNMYGRQYMGIERSTFLIDGTGKIARIWPKVKVKGHAEEVLAAVKAL